MAVVFTPTQNDFVAANRLIFKGRIHSNRSVLPVLVLFGTTIAGGLVYVWNEDFTTQTVLMAAVLAWWILFIPMIVIVQGYLVERASRRIFDQQRSLQLEATVDWSSNGIRFATANANVALDWSDVVKITEDDTTLLLFQSEASAQYIPKRALQQEDIESIKAHLR